MALMWIVVALFLFLTIVFYMGKGAFLIAGYNTSSQEDRNKVDEKKLCHVMGNGMLIITLVLIAQILLEDLLPAWLSVGVVVLDTIYVLIVGNTRCKRNETTLLSTTSNQSKKLSVGTSIIIGLVVIFAVVCILFSGDVRIKAGASKLSAKATLVSTTEVNYIDIKKIELVENIDTGNRTNGVGDFKVNAGHFKNKEYGRYMLYSFIDCNMYVVITLHDNTTVVVNEDSVEKTKDLYQTIQDKL